MNRFPSRLRLLLCGLAVFGGLALAPGVSRAQDVTPLLPDSPEAREHLRQEDLSLHEYIVERMRETISRAEAGPASRRTRKRVRNWCEFVIRETDEILEDKDPLTGLFDLWALSVQMEDYVRTGEGQDTFGLEQRLVIEAMADIREEVRFAAERNFESATYESARENILQYARENPLDYDASFLSRLFDLRQVPFSLVRAGESTIKSVASVPLIPKRAGEGIRRGTAQLRDFNETASRFTDVVEQLPRRTREELEVLLDKLDDQASTLTLLTDGLEKTAQSVNEAMQTAERLSPDARETVKAVDETARTLEGTARSIEQAAVELGSLLDGVERLSDRFTTGSAETTSGDGDEDSLPESYAEAARAIESGAAEIRRMLGDINEMMEPEDAPPGEGEGRPFDIREYTEAARAIERGGAEIRGILADLRATAEDESLGESSEGLFARAVEANDRISSRFESLVDHLLLRLGLFLLFVTAVLLAYRGVRSRWFPDRKPPA